MKYGVKELKDYLLNSGVFVNNEYLDKYVCLLVDECTNYEQYKTAKHHIIPKSICKKKNIFADSENNIIILSHKNHIIAHFYIAMCVCNEFYFSAANAVSCMFYNYTSGHKIRLSKTDLEDLDVIKYSDNYQILMEAACKYRSEINSGKKLSKESIQKTIDSRHNNGRP